VQSQGIKANAIMEDWNYNTNEATKEQAYFFLSLSTIVRPVSPCEIVYLHLFSKIELISPKNSLACILIHLEAQWLKIDHIVRTTHSFTS